MSTTAKIDFEPDLFDDDPPEAAPDQPTIQPKRRESRNPFIVEGGLLILVAVLVAVLMMKHTFAGNDGSAIPINVIDAPMDADDEPIFQFIPEIAGKAPVVKSESFCAGNETLCSTSLTDKPAETLAKLAAALPGSEAKRYRVKVSVVPLDE